MTKLIELKEHFSDLNSYYSIILRSTPSELTDLLAAIESLIVYEVEQIVMEIQEEAYEEGYREAKEHYEY